MHLGDPDDWLKVYAIVAALATAAAAFGVGLWRFGAIITRFDITLANLSATQAKHSEAIERLTERIGAIAR